MGYQALNGITVKPIGSQNISRFQRTFDNTQSWPTSFAFGGWIYNASCDIGFNNQPSEIRLSIVLETENKSQQAAVFDINIHDLKGDAGNGADENLYDINLNGISFTNFVLFSYEINVETGPKILNVTFKDYSVVLDKIYIGLIKRQGNRHVYTARSLIDFPINCADCLLDGSSFKTNGYAYRNINYGSYVGINGKVYDNFASLNTNQNIFVEWEKLFKAKISPVKFDLNGGYLLLGTEEVTEELCGNIAGMSYNFNQLLASLRFRGMKFEGSFPKAINDSNFAYKQNYIGTLREVLQQWCSDLGYDFYCDGKTFIGINLNRPLDISKVVDIADPNTDFGSQFALNKNTAILSYKETNTLANSFRQAVITTNNFPKQVKTHSKSVKRYVGLLPMHPLDFNSPQRGRVLKRDIFGHLYHDSAWTNSFDPGSADLDKILYQLDNRLFSDVDVSIALSNYSDELRDIYCQDGALYGETEDIKNSNFKALGMMPIIEVTGSEEKFLAINASLGDPGDAATDTCRDARYYKVYVGYYYPKLKNDIVSWEKKAAESMYKFGLLTKGILRRFPYMSPNITQDVSPAAGLFGTQGTSFIRVKHNYEPDAKRYYDLYDAPYKDLLIYSGLKNVDDYFPTGLYVAEISNEWGTTQESFQRELALNLSDACVDEFGQQENFIDFQLSMPRKFQDWKLELFRPKANADIKDFQILFGESLQKIDKTNLQIDRTVQAYYDLHYNASPSCSKLHIMVLTDTRVHPNVSIDFIPKGRNFINPVMLHKYVQQQKEAHQRRSEYQTPSLCDLSLLQEMCDNIISGANLFNPDDPRFDCVLHSTTPNVFEEGFAPSYLFSPNSRGLEINITKNPIRNTDTDFIQSAMKGADEEGLIYFSDIMTNELTYRQQQASLTIIYPLSVNPEDDIYYRDILTTDIEIQNRSPEIDEMYGEPPNSAFNGATNIKVINNPVDPDLPPQLDPYSNKFVTYVTVITGNGQILKTVEQYHSFVANLNSYQLTGASKSIELKLAGTPDFFGSFTQYLSPIYGLNKLNINVGGDGVSTSLSFSDRPPVLPKQESILNKISARIVKK